MIVTFFTGGVGQGSGLTLNQWRLISDFITSQGIQAITGNRVSLHTWPDAVEDN